MGHKFCSLCNGTGHEGRCDHCGGSGFVNPSDDVARSTDRLSLTALPITPNKNISKSPKITIQISGRTITDYPTNPKLDHTSGISKSPNKKTKAKEKPTDSNIKAAFPAHITPPTVESKWGNNRPIRTIPHPSQPKISRPRLVSSGKWTRVTVDEAGQEKRVEILSRPRGKQKDLPSRPKNPTKRLITSVNTENCFPAPKNRQKQAKNHFSEEKTVIEIAFEKVQKNQDGSKDWGGYREPSGQFGSFPSFDSSDDSDFDE